jgi:hypothetical protein
MTEGFGQGDVNAEVDELIIFQDLLYAVIYDGSGEKGLEIWRSATGDPDDWSRVVDDGFGNIENAAIVAHAIYSDRLYVGTFTLTGTAQLYSTSDGLKWDFVNDFNLGNILNRRVTSLEVFNHYLYAAVVEKGELSEMVARVYRCSVCEGDDWEVVLDGPYENTGTFRKPGLKVYRNHLYYAVGNFDAEVEITASRGLELWRTEDGISWERLATEGFGDPNNAWTYFDNAMAVFGDGLYIATDNKVTGVEVWRVAYSQ